MANIRIKDLSTTASSTASDDFFGVDGATNGTRKLDAYSPTFGGNLTVSGITSTFGPASAYARVSANTGSNLELFTPSAGTSVLIRAGSATIATFADSGLTTLAGNLTVSGTGTIAGVQAYRSSGTTQQLRIGYDSSNYWDLSRDNASTGNLVLRSSNVGAGATALLTFSNSTGDATLAGNLTVNGSVVNQNGVIQSTLAAGALISSLSTNNNAVHGFQISGTGTGTRDWRLEQCRGGANSFSISNATGGLTTPLIVNGVTDNILIGHSSTSSDSGNGKLQLATHSTSAGGIGFGTDTTLYRTGSGFVQVDALSSNNPAFKLAIAGTAKAWIEYYSPDSKAYITTADNLAFRTNGGTTALTLDTSLNATFAGTINVNGTATSTVKGTIVSDVNTNTTPAFRSKDTINSGDSWRFGIGTTVDNQTFGFYDETTSTAVLSLGRTGNATFAGNVYGTSNLVLLGTSGTNGNIYLRAQGAGYVRVDTGSGFRVETGKVSFTSLPTSSAGLSSGDLWNDSGTLKIV